MTRFLSVLLFLLTITFQFSCGQKQSGGELSKEDTELVERMKTADVAEIKAYIRQVIDQPLPEGYEIPEHIKNAKDHREASQIVGQRYPEFFGKEGPDYIRAVAADPIKYRQLIQESRAMRKFFAGEVYENGDSEQEKNN